MKTLAFTASPIERKNGAFYNVGKGILQKLATATCSRLPSHSDASYQTEDLD